MTTNLKLVVSLVWFLAASEFVLFDEQVYPAVVSSSPFVPFVDPDGFEFNRRGQIISPKQQSGRQQMDAKMFAMRKRKKKSNKHWQIRYKYKYKWLSIKQGIKYK